MTIQEAESRKSSAYSKAKGLYYLFSMASNFGGRVDKRSIAVQSIGIAINEALEGNTVFTETDVEIMNKE